jgi:phosphoserine phosphatase
MQYPPKEHAPGLVIQGFVPPIKLARFKLAAFDMDSTLINIECIDEIADAAGRKAEVAAITAAAMRGEITDYKESLRRRLALLKGVPEAALEEVYTQRLQINPGVEKLTQALKATGCKLMLLSGGFTFFTERIRERLNFDYARANMLEIKDGKLTGQLIPQIWGDICDGDLKRSTLLQTATGLRLALTQTLVVGDGANDLPMMQACAEGGGLSVAYHAKPKVREQAMVAINEGGLDRLLTLLN